jgi:RNA-directed DNA polymerase
MVHRNAVKLCRYADDFVITGNSKELLEGKVKPVIENFLKVRDWSYRKRKPRLRTRQKALTFWIKM